MTGYELRCHKMGSLRPGKHLLLRAAWAGTCVCAQLCVPTCTFVYAHVSMCVHTLHPNLNTQETQYKYVRDPPGCSV